MATMRHSPDGINKNFKNTFESIMGSPQKFLALASFWILFLVELFFLIICQSHPIACPGRVKASMCLWHLFKLSVQHHWVAQHVWWKMLIANSVTILLIDPDWLSFPHDRVNMCLTCFSTFTAFIWHSYPEQRTSVRPQTCKAKLKPLSAILPSYCKLCQKGQT